MEERGGRVKKDEFSNLDTSPGPYTDGSDSHQAEANEGTGKTALGGKNAILAVSARLGGWAEVFTE